MHEADADGHVATPLPAPAGGAAPLARRLTPCAPRAGRPRTAYGAGEDVLSGDSGNDRIDARDGEPDAIDCGGGLLDWAAVDIGAEASIIAVPRSFS